MELLGGKWTSRIICVLAALGTLRYSELRHEMGNITDAVLASTLKGLSQLALLRADLMTRYRRGSNTLLRRRAHLLFRFCRASANGQVCFIRTRATRP